MMESDPLLSGHTQGIQRSAPNPDTLSESGTSASALRNTALILLAAIFSPAHRTFVILASNRAPVVLQTLDVVRASYITYIDGDRGSIIWSSEPTALVAAAHIASPCRPREGIITAGLP
jgi:hypothetical protein